MWSCNPWVASSGSEIVGSAELRKREDEIKTGGNWTLPFPPFSPQQLFESLLLLRLPHYLSAWNRLMRESLLSSVMRTPTPVRSQFWVGKGSNLFRTKESSFLWHRLPLCWGKNVIVAFRKTHIVCARRFVLKKSKQFFNLFYWTTNVSFSSRRLVLYSSLNLSRVFYFGDLVFNCWHRLILQNFREKWMFDIISIKFIRGYRVALISGLSSVKD